MHQGLRVLECRFHIAPVAVEAVELGQEQSAVVEPGARHFQAHVLLKVVAAADQERSVAVAEWSGRQEIAETLDAPTKDEVEEELSALMRVFGQG